MEIPTIKITTGKSGARTVGGYLRRYSLLGRMAVVGRRVEITVLVPSQVNPQRLAGLFRQIVGRFDTVEIEGGFADG